MGVRKKLKIKNFKLKINRGFTLIELLVVMAIIGILAALALTSFNTAQKNSRDTRRKSDLQQYRNALEAYASNNKGVYPSSGGGIGSDESCVDGGIFDASGLIIIEYLPAKIPDPSEGTSCSGTACNGSYCTYVYTTSTGGSTSIIYTLTARLETGGIWEICSIGKAGKTTTQPSGGNCNL